MRTFKDVGGREWTINITVNTLKRVKAAMKFDLLSVVEDRNLLVRLATDPECTVDTLAVLCESQMVTAGVDAVAFAEALGGGDVFEAACEAMLEAIADFFPKHRREPLQHALAKLRQVQTVAADRAKKAIDEVDMEKLLSATVGSSSTTLPASSA